MHVLLITEGTYPFHFGGVSTWCHTLLRELHEVNFTLMSLVSDPRVELRYQLPPNVVEFRPVALWGVHQVMETLPRLGLGEVRRRYSQSTETVVANEFVPVFRSFLREIFSENSEPQRLARTIHQMHRFFVAYDFDRTMRSKAVWASFVQTAQELYPGTAARHGYANAAFSLSDLTKSMQWLYHVFFPIAQPLPKADIAHAAMAGTCSLIAVCLKLEHGAPYFLTEHGIYLRECYLAEAATPDSLFLKLLRLRYARRMTELSYTLADQISPCCDYNKRWELRLGAPPDRLKTIYYGVDSTEFSPGGKTVGKSPAVVVWVGRINPLKDLHTLLHAAATVNRSRPDVQFRFYGSAAPEDQPYYRDILDLRSRLGLNDAVVFGGYVSKPAAAFNEGDVVVLSSISEAFPFSVLEAMLCAKPVVATDVGGVPEEIKGCGIIVEPRNSEAMARAILELMNDPQRCAALGTAARVRAEQEFSVKQTKYAHFSTYLDLLRQREESSSQLAEARTASSQYERLAEYEPVYRSRNNGYNGGHGASGHTASLTLPTAASNGAHRSAAEPPRYHRDGITRRLAEMDPERSQAILALAADVSQHVVRPVDSLEITALIESLGVTDEIAVRRYGASDTFELAETILDCVRKLLVRDSEESQRQPIPAQANSA